MPQTPVTAKQFADEFYKNADDQSPQNAIYHQMADEIAAKHIGGLHGARAE